MGRVMGHRGWTWLMGSVLVAQGPGAPPPMTPEEVGREAAWSRWLDPAPWPTGGDRQAPPPSRASWERLQGRAVLATLLRTGREAEARRWMKRWAEAGGWRGALEDASALAREQHRPALDNAWGRLVARGRQDPDVGWDQVARKASRLRAAQVGIGAAALGAVALALLLGRRRRAGDERR